jgi:predicted dehydrogenase
VTVNRRNFIKRVSAASAGAAIFPSILPSRVFGAGAPGNKIVMGCIGVGSQGSGNMNRFLNDDAVRIVGVCDVDARHTKRAKETVDKKYGNQDCAEYKDFRELIGRGDLDAVTIAVPDHWHALLAVTAARAGLDIYGEKPLARSIREGQAICDAVRRCGRVWQTGSMQRSMGGFRTACELVRNGRIGKVHKVEVGLPTGSGCEPQAAMPIPPELDWEMWLGPAPYAPYTEKRCHWNWRWILDYSGGQLTDWAGHHIDIAHWGMGFELTGPQTIEGKGDYPADGLWNAPTKYLFDCTYANGTVIQVGDGSRFPNGTKWIGDKGWIFVSRGKLEAEPTSILKEVIGPEEIHLYDSRDHHRNFLECVRTRQPTVTPADQALRSISVGQLGEIAMLTGRKIRWNPETQEILNDPGASALLGRTYREPWYL